MKHGTVEARIVADARKANRKSSRRMSKRMSAMGRVVGKRLAGEVIEFLDELFAKPKEAAPCES